MGDISEGVADTLKPAKKIYKKSIYFSIQIPHKGSGETMCIEGLTYYKFINDNK